ncbi:MAG TPA: PAS domain S-box protein [Gemmatimonadaceae bacterium]|nr:PAS domain S-box protein [Gemmatimonadaceae bacterium]
MSKASPVAVHVPGPEERAPSPDDHALAGRLRIIARLARRALGVPRVAVLLTAPEMPHLVVEGEPSSDPDDEETLQAALADGLGLCAAPGVDGARPTAVVAGSGAAALAAVAVLGGHVLVCAVSDTPRHWDEPALDVLRDAADAMAEPLRAHAAARDAEEGRDLLGETERLVGSGSWEWEIGGRVRVSEGMWRIVGVEPRDGPIEMDEFLSRVHRDDRPAVLEVIRRAAADGGPHRLRHRFVRVGGEVRTLSAHLRRRSGGPGGPDRLLGVSRDVTGEEVALGALRESESRYRLLFEENPLPMLIFAVDTLEILAVNDAAVAQYGWSHEEFRRLSLLDLRAPEDVPMLYQALSVLPDGAKVTRRVRHRRRDGRVLYVDTHGHALSFEHRAARLVLAHDVSEQVAAELAMRASEARFRAFVEQSIDGTFVLDATGTILYASPSATRLTGHPASSMVGTNVLGYLHDDDRERTRQTLALLVSPTTTAHRVEVRVRHLDGGWRAMEAVGRALPNSEAGEGEAHALVTIRDITERRRTEEALRASEERFRSLIASSPLGVFLSDVNGAITYANPRAAEMWGVPAAELMAFGWESLVHPDDRDMVLGAWTEAAAEGREFQAEYRIVLHDGQQRWLHEMGRPLRGASGEITGMVSTVEDVSSRRELEAQLRQAQKMEAVGQLAGGVAHDFNNLLTVIKAHSEFLLEALPEGDATREDAREIGLAASRAASLTRQLLAFSRKQLLRPRALDINVVVTELAPMLHRLIGEDVAIEVRATAAQLGVRADPGQLEQVLMNLAVNARDAMPAGGVIAITTGQQRLDDPMPHEHGVVPAGNYVVLEVADSGSGMPDHVRQRAFEPFFTTKGPGRGTGLGLATVYGIVRQSGGHVTLHSEVSRGTTFRVYLPATEADAAATEGSGGVSPATRRGTILLVEDEAPLRALARRMLEREGHTVLEASGARHALTLAAEREDVDLLLTDVVMPEMNGRELSELVAKQRPRVRTVYMSGYTDDVIVRRGELSPRLVVVHKPFTAEDLLGAVRRALSNG